MALRCDATLRLSVTAVIGIVEASGKERIVWKKAQGLEELRRRWQWNSEGVGLVLVPIPILDNCTV